MLGNNKVQLPTPFSEDEERMVRAPSPVSVSVVWIPTAVLFPEILFSGCEVEGSIRRDEVSPVYISRNFLQPLAFSRDVVGEGLNRAENFSYSGDFPDGVVLSHFNPLFHETLLVSDLSLDTVAGKGMEEGHSRADEAVVRRRRGLPKKIISRGRKKKDLGALIAMDSGLPLTDSQAKESSLILPEALGSDGVMNRARRNLIIAKHVGVVFNGTDEEAIQSYAKHLIANHPRLYGGS